MKNVLLKIAGRQYTDETAKSEADNDPIEFVTEGRLYEEDGATILEYDETELSGLEGCTTRLSVTPRHVSMARTGAAAPLGTKMEFEIGRRITGLYQTDFGSFEMELLTNSIQTTLTPSGGAVSIDYHVSLKGFGAIRNLLEIEVLKEMGPADGEADAAGSEKGEAGAARAV